MTNRHRGRVLALLALALLVSPLREADATINNWPHGVCRDITVTVSRVPGDPDRLAVRGSSPADTCVIVRTNPQTAPLGWTPRTGRVVSFETTLLEDSVLCTLPGATSATQTTIDIQADGEVDELTAGSTSVMHLGVLPDVLASTVTMVLVRQPQLPGDKGVVVAEATFVRDAADGCDFSTSQTWTGTLTFVDPDGDALLP